MISTKPIVKYTKRLKKELIKNIDIETNSLWLKDNRNRIINMLQNIETEIPVLKLPESDGEVKVFALARETVEQTDGIFNENTLDILKDFTLTFREYSVFGIFVKINLLALLNKSICENDFKKYTDNAVKSLIEFPKVDFAKYAEKYLPQEKTLLEFKDYRNSNENTKNIYRDKISEIAEKSNKSEIFIAEKAVNDLTENLFGIKTELFRSENGLTPNKENTSAKLFFYLLFPAIISVLSFISVILNASSVWQYIFGIITLFPAFICALTIENRVILQNIKVKYPFRLSEKYADIKENKTAISLTVVVPDTDSAIEFTEKIEKCYVSNRIENGVYLILADFASSKSENANGDEEIYEKLKAGIEYLNGRYHNKFALIIRKRNKQGDEYFGRERKRGAIEDLVKYISGEKCDFHTVLNGGELENCKYILTLDGDTVMSPQSLIKLIATIAHPANANKGLVQPNIGVMPKKTTPFFKIMTDRWGIDSYNIPAKEVLSDYFSSGTFCGKGIFSVQKYAEYVVDKIEPMTVLSHDILEGEMLNTVNASDITLLDEFPDNAISFYKRRERWIRGDWQLLPCIKGLSSPISKWKIINNCINSLFPVFVMLQVLLSCFCGKFFLCFLSLAVFELLLPSVIVYIDALLFDREKHIFYDKKAIRHNSIKRFLLLICALPYEAYSSFASTVIALWRRFVSHKNTLKWNTFASVSAKCGIGGYYSFFACQMALAVASFFVFVINGKILWGFFFLTLWCITPYLMWNLAQIRYSAEEELLPDEIYSLKLLKIRTQRFFFSALKDNNYLMPDNLQIKPDIGYAKRTSPTNIGFGILSVICGIRDGEYSPKVAIDLLDGQINVIEKSEKYRGHLYNWYNTENKKVMSRYISTVDSGNLCACLLTASKAIEDVLNQNIVSKKISKTIGNCIFAFIDEADEDFAVELKNIANEFYGCDERDLKDLINKFLNNKMLSDKVPYVRDIVQDRLTDIEKMTFSQGVINEANGYDDALYKMLADFPRSVKGILEYGNIDCKINQCFCGKDESGFSDLKRRITEEFYRIYGYAFEINEKVKKFISFAERFTDEADFSFLYNEDKKLLAIGFDEEKEKQSENFYDMLCSEARLTSYFCIASGKIPAEHWFRLMRPFSRFNNEPLCLSWGGTMFEYLMPDIFLPLRRDSMLGISSKLAVEAQMQVKSKNGIWGISESAFNALDRTNEYKYKAFGVNKTAVSAFNEEKVFSPYSTILALEYNKREAMNNIIRLVENGMAGNMGMYEAVDFKRPFGVEGGIVYSYMAHHSGMSLCALTNFLYGDYLKKSFLKEQYISASLVLLDEKIPIGVKPRKELKYTPALIKTENKPYVREFMAPNIQASEQIIIKGENVSAHIDSNGGIKVYFGKKYVGNVNVYFIDEKQMSASYEPLKDDSMKYYTEFVPGKVEFVSENKNYNFRLCCFASNNGIVFSATAGKSNKSAEKVKVAFLMNTVLDYEDVFESHPAFNGLFIQCEKIKNGVKVFNRRSLTNAYVYSIENTEKIGTDRFYALGRNRDESSPKLSEKFRKYPINPCVLLSSEMDLTDKTEEKISFVVGKDCIISNNASVQLHLEKSKNIGNALVSSFNIDNAMWKYSMIILSSMKKRCVNLYANPDILWRYGISENKPLLSVQVTLNRNNTEKILKTVNYLYYLGADFNLLLIEDAPEDYLNIEYNLTEQMIESMNNRESIFHIKMQSRDETEKIKSFSFMFINTENDLFEEFKQETKQIKNEKIVPKDNPYPESLNSVPEGIWDNGFGKFTDSGEYYIYSPTPAPWVNVVGFGNMGFIGTESGGGYTFCKNSALNKLSTWTNDPVCDKVNEAVYIRDNELMRIWSITRNPIDLGDEHDALFGQGFITYGYNGFGIKQTQTEFVHESLPIKIISVELDNIKNRDLNLYFYFSVQMGEKKDDAQKMLEIVLIDEIPCVKKNNEYVFIYAENSKYTTNEQQFLGNGGIKNPNGIKYGFNEEKQTKQGRICLALEKKAEKQNDIFVCFAESADKVREYLNIIKTTDTAYEKKKTNEKFKDLTGKIKITTPDKKTDLLFNNWLLYQVTSSRMFCRCGYYQAGGAYGFRDQLQDCIALLPTQPELVKKHILRCAAHQFKEGDVQHWWHEKFKGVRTNISDDLLFLPLLVAKYIVTTGDRQILNEIIPFIEGHNLNGKTDIYEEAWISEETADLYSHCMRAVKLVVFRSGEHFLPLILGGDWNDGMNKIGHKGKGESVWLGWFLYYVISEFLQFANDNDREFLTEHARKLYNSLNTYCWDGKWYLRAFDDHGNFVGGQNSSECKIDSVSQSWAVLSGAGKREMCESALNSAYENLVDGNNGIVKLLTPPINNNLGYIGDYIPGIRENGGQYTHGAIWLASAFSQIGESEKCYEILKMLNPINHAFDRKSTEKYMIEPYVMPGDVYSNEEWAGRGGWSWYTGSASLYYDAILSDLLGIKIQNGNITVEPHIPANWNEYKVYLENENIEIKVMNPNRKTSGVSNISTVEKDGKKEIRVVM